MPKEICSFSAKLLPTFRLSTIRPTGLGGNSFSGHTLVSSSGSKSSSGMLVVAHHLDSSSHSG